MVLWALGLLVRLVLRLDVRACLAGQRLPRIWVYDRIASVHVRCRWGIPALALWRGRRFVRGLWWWGLGLLMGIIGGVLLLAERRLLGWRSGWDVSILLRVNGRAIC
jgi:hypothetical protein